MGHHANAGRTYEQLQKHMIRTVQGAAESPVLMKILTMLFSPGQVALAGIMPHRFTSLEALSKKAGIPEAELRGTLEDMARRGLVFDIKKNGRSYYVLPPVVIGLFEFTFMRARTDMPMKELAALFDQYFTENDGAFSRTVLAGKTQQFRTLVREEAVPEERYTEILDWERATSIVASAATHAVGICQCHHVAQHQGDACGKPSEVCLTFGFAADSLARNGIARRITRDEAMKILLDSKEAGLAQTADNVRSNVAFLCNCCGCCCHLMRGIRTLDIRPGLVTSNFIMEVDPARCKGCGSCATACPVDAVAIEETTIDGRRKKHAVRDEQACLGCGICVTKCKTGAAAMKSRPRRVIVPENVFEQRVMMAIERGKLADLIFDDPGKLSHRALARVLGALERTSPVKALMAAQTLDSVFLKSIVKAAKKQTGELSRVLT